MDQHLETAERKRNLLPDWLRLRLPWFETVLVCDCLSLQLSKFATVLFRDCLRMEPHLKAAEREGNLLPAAPGTSTLPSGREHLKWFCRLLY